MPPARKDSPQGDDLSRPSTSRAFSPSLAPPVKRAKSSLGGAPPPSSSSNSRRSMGGRQARIDEFVDEKELQEGLLVAAMETADELLKEDEEMGKEKIEIDNEVISATAKIVWDAMAEDWATDLVAFSRHAGRENIREDDVKLMMRRNPNLLAEILAECEEEEDGEGEGGTTMGTTKRKSTGGLQSGRPQKESREEMEDDMEIIDFITPLRTSSVTSMTSVVPETPNGIVPLAHSTPMNGQSVAMKMARRAIPDFSIPSPIREDGEKREEGRRVNRSIMNDLSDTIKDGNEETMGGVNTQHMDGDFVPLVVDLRHPEEQEEEERRMRAEANGETILSQTYQLPGPSARIQDYGRESPVLFDEEEKEADYDSFDDDVVFKDDLPNKNKKRAEDVSQSQRMSESAAIREMLDGGEEEMMGRTVVIQRDQRDSFDDEDESIQFVETKMVTPSTRSAPSSAKANASMVLSGLPAMPAVVPPPPSTSTGAAPIMSAVAQINSQDSFYNDEILTDPPQAPTIPVPATVPIVQQPPLTVASPATVQPVRPADYDSFDDDDDDFVSTPTNRSKENIPKAIEAPVPKTTVANRWSTVEVAEVVSQSPATQKKSAINRGVFAEDIFGLNEQPTTSKPAPISKLSPTVPSRASPTVSSKPPTVPARPSQAATMHQKPSPTVATKPSPTVRQKPSQSTVKKTPVKKDVKAPSTGFSTFSFFGDESQAAKIPTVKREDSDFIDTSNRQTTSMSKTTPRGRGGARGGRGFPRRVDPNSKTNRKIREQSTPVSLTPRPPSRINEVIDSFEDDDFDHTAFDD